MKISSLRNLGPPFSPRLKLVRTSLIVPCAVLPCACRPSIEEQTNLTFLDPEWSHDAGERSVRADATLQELTQQTGIRVKHLPLPETSPRQLALIRDLLQKKAPTPDGYGIGVIWPGVLSKYLVDLKPYLRSEMSSEDPEMLRNYTFQEKLVAVPYHANTGVLFYLDLEESKIQREDARSEIRLDLDDLTLIDVGVVRFVSQCEESGVELQNCPLYVRELIEQESEDKCGGEITCRCSKRTRLGVKRSATHRQDSIRKRRVLITMRSSEVRERENPVHLSGSANKPRRASIGLFAELPGIEKMRKTHYRKLC